MKILEIENTTNKILAVHGDYAQITLDKIRISKDSYFESTALDTTSATGGKTFESGIIVDEVVIPVIPLPITDISVTKTRFKVGDVVQFNFTSELSDDSFYIPYMVYGDTRKYLKEAVVTNGVGVIDFTFNSGGIYYIDATDLDLTTLKINGNAEGKFTIYVAE